MSAALLDAERLHVFLDFDGTITETDTLQFLVAHFGGGRESHDTTDRLIREGRLTLRDGIARDMAALRVPFDEAAPRLRAEVAVDSGFAPLMRWCEAREVPVTVLSAGFRELIDLFIDAGEFPDLDIRANHFEPGTWRAVFRDAGPLGHDKSVPVREARAAGCYTVFVGDGVSDIEPAAVADEVFARAGRSLVGLCRDRGIACRTFETLAEVRDSLDGRLRTRRTSHG